MIGVGLDGRFSKTLAVTGPKWLHICGCCKTMEQEGSRILFLLDVLVGENSNSRQVSIAATVGWTPPAWGSLRKTPHVWRDEALKTPHVWRGEALKTPHVWRGESVQLEDA